MRLGLSVEYGTIDDWLDKIWRKTISREELGKLIEQEYANRKLSRSEFEQILKQVFTSMR